MPKTWLAAQGGTAAVTAVATPRVMRTSVLQAFVKFGNAYAIPMNHRVLAVTQLGSMPMKTAATWPPATRRTPRPERESK